MAKVDKDRPKKGSNEEWKHPHDEDARITKMQDGRTDLAIVQSWARGEGLERAAELIEHDWERMVSFYRYPKAHWQNLRTTNLIESPFAALRLRTDAATRFKKAANATAVIWKMLLVAETKFRKLNALELL